MPNILTPVTLWTDFDSSLDTRASILDTTEEDGIVIERLKFSGRETGEGRVRIASAFAYDKNSPSSEAVLLLPDSKDTIDDGLLKMFVKNGYSALMVDYRGVWTGGDFYTVYPQNIDYANYAKSGRHMVYVDDTATATSWYEWVAVGIYARKYIEERIGNSNIAVVGLRDGGEIAWKLGVAGSFKCIVPVCAAGWKAYSGISKYLPDEPVLNEERYRFIAGIDSQAYAPYVKCPVLMLCSTNDSRFDYDRAYDTFSRINPKFNADSAIAYSVQCNGCIGDESVNDLFMFLDRNLKNRQVFIPKPAVVAIEVDEESNLIAWAKFDDQGVVADCSMYLAEDCIDSALREWTVCPQKSKISSLGQQFYLNIYEKTSTVFALCSVTYINGFTVWSRTVVKKISGKFRNMQSKCKVLYSDKDGTYGFTIANSKKYATGGMFFEESNALPQLTSINGVKGLYSAGGLTTCRMSNPRYSPSIGNVLKLDIFCDESAEVFLQLHDLATGEEYVEKLWIVGKVWQTAVCEYKVFKNPKGVPLAAFSANFKFSVICSVPCAVNNVMWL